VFTFAGDKSYSFRPSVDGPGSGAALGATADASMQQVTVVFCVKLETNLQLETIYFYWLKEFRYLQQATRRRFKR
jgi:hypothetical protein